MKEMKERNERKERKIIFTENYESFLLAIRRATNK